MIAQFPFYLHKLHFRSIIIIIIADFCQQSHSAAAVVSLELTGSSREQFEEHTIIEECPGESCYHVKKKKKKVQPSQVMPRHHLVLILLLAVLIKGETSAWSFALTLQMKNPFRQYNNNCWLLLLLLLLLLMVNEQEIRSISFLNYSYSHFGCIFPLFCYATERERDTVGMKVQGAKRNVYNWNEAKWCIRLTL